MTHSTPENLYPNILRRLSESSVHKHFDAYADVAWDDPAYAIDPTDPRWEKSSTDPLGATAWYRAQPANIRARIGLHHIVSQLKTGLAFENVLSRGLLEFAMTLPNGSPEFRYAYHELIEEGQHTLMFQEFVNRSGIDAPGLSGLDAFGARHVPRLGRAFPELFFLFVLGGEAPIDYVQRRELGRARDGAVIHPLLHRIMQIHVTEEARHLCFARRYLEEHVPKLGHFRRTQLAVRTPIILKAMSGQMLRPPKHLVRTYDIPSSVIREAYSENAAHHATVRDGLESVRALCLKLGLVSGVGGWLWQALGIAPTESGDEQGAGDVGSPATLRPAAVTRTVPGIIRAAPPEWIRPSLAA